MPKPEDDMPTTGSKAPFKPNYPASFGPGYSDGSFIVPLLTVIAILGPLLWLALTYTQPQ